jgi:hypothetical protein
MASDWRGWRLIVVNGERFRWRKSWDGDARVRPESRPERMLFIRGGYPTAVPHRVRMWIEAANTCGWPQSVPNLELSATENAFTGN